MTGVVLADRTPPDMGALAERMVPLAQEFACLIRDEDVDSVGVFLAPFTRQELYGLLIVTAAMTDIDRPVSELLAWVGWEDPEPATRRGTWVRQQVKPCGTAAAYQRHLSRQEEPCKPCRVARTADNAASTERRRKRRQAARATAGVAA